MKRNTPRTRASWFTYQNGIMLLLFFTFGFLFMDRLSVVFLFPFIQKDLGLTVVDLGLLASGLSVTWALSGYVFGTVADYIGSRKRILIPATIVFSICSIASGLARNFVSLLAARMVMGISEGPGLPIVQSTATEESSPHRVGLNAGFVQSSSQLLGATLGPIIVTAIAAAYDWRAAFYVVAIPGLIVAVLLWKYMKERGQSAISREKLAQTDGDGSPHKLTRADYLQVFKQRNVWVCLLISILFMTWLFAYSTFAPTYLVKVGYAPTQMGLVMAGLGLGSFMWQILVPYLSDHFGRKPILIMFSFLACISPLLLIFYHGPVLVLFAIMTLITTGNGVFPLFMVVIPSESVASSASASTIGLVQLVGELVGGTIMPSVAGIIASSYGLTAPLWIAVGGAVLAGIVGFWLKETAPVITRKRQRIHQST